MGDMVDFDATARRCAPLVTPSTLRAIAQVESSLNPYAIGIVQGRLLRQPRNLPEAISTVITLREKGVKFSAGMIQIYVQNWAVYNLDPQTVFDPCANMRAAAGILTNCFRRASHDSQHAQIALRNALSCYYSNNFVTGYQHGYVQRVVSTALNFNAAALNPARKGSL